MKSGRTLAAVEFDLGESYFREALVRIASSVCPLATLATVIFLNWTDSIHFPYSPVHHT
jgi:hypothetical protein